MRTPEYDQRGNLRYSDASLNPAIGTIEYRHAWDNRLWLVQHWNGSAWDPSPLLAFHDALGRRTESRVNGVWTQFIHDGERVVEERNGNHLDTATLARSYAFGDYLDEPVAMIDEAPGSQGNTHYYLHDRRYSVVALIDASGGVAESYAYTSFGLTTIYNSGGAVIASSALGNTTLFTGRRYDHGSQTYDYRARNYLPELGRFLQRDPAGYIDGYNLYAYVGNNPLRFLDPSGLGKVDQPQQTNGGNWWGSLVRNAQQAVSSAYNTAERRILDAVDATLSYTIDTLEPIDQFNRLHRRNLFSDRWMHNTRGLSTHIADSFVLAGETPGNLMTIRDYIPTDPLGSTFMLGGAVNDTRISIEMNSLNAAENAGRGLYNLGALGVNQQVNAATFGAVDRALPSVDPARYWAGNYGVGNQYYSASLSIDLIQFGGESLAGEGVFLGITRGVSYGDNVAGYVDDLARQVDNAGSAPRAANNVAPSRGASWFDEVAKNATRNTGSNKLVLGHFATEGPSYQKVAAHYKATYFKVDDWNTVTKGLSQDEIWRINETFLTQQIRQGKQILLSHDPLKARAGSFFEREVNFLKDLGYTFKQNNEWTWEAVR